MKINWGTGIAIFYSCFVAIMIFMVVKSSQNNVHLVQENYYQKDLGYEEFRSKRQNSTELSTPVTIKLNNDQNTMEFSFPKDMKEVKGKLLFFRPSNKYMDKTYDLKLDGNSKMILPLDATIPSGLWRIKIDWESQGKYFYKEESIVI